MTNSGILCFPGGTSGKELIYLMQKTEVMPIPSLDQGSSPEGGHGTPLQYSWASLVAQLIKNLPAT